MMAKKKVNEKKMMSNSMFGEGGGGRQRLGGKGAIHRPVQDGQITEFQNFLKQAPVQMFNVKPKSFDKQQGKAVFEFEANLQGLQHLNIVVNDRSSVVQKTIDLPSDVITKRDLRLKRVLNESKGLTENRATVKLSPDEGADTAKEHFIEDIRSSETMIVDNL